MNRRFVVILTALIAVATFAGGATFYNRLQADKAAESARNFQERLVRAHSPIMGKAEAPVTIVEFFDPSCEACRAFYPYVKQIMSMVGPDVRLVLRYTPLHKGSDEAVRILEAARIQNKFEPVLEAILERQPEWAQDGSPDLEKAWQIAVAAGFNLDEGRAQAKSPAVEAVLKQDIEDMQVIGVRQTPTFYVNGKPLTEFSPQGLLNQVQTELKALGKPGT